MINSDDSPSTTISHRIPPIPRFNERLQTVLELARLEDNLACDDWWIDDVHDDVHDEGQPTTSRASRWPWARLSYIRNDNWPWTPMSHDDEEEEDADHHSTLNPSHT